MTTPHNDRREGGDAPARKDTTAPAHRHGKTDQKGEDLAAEQDASWGREWEVIPGVASSGGQGKVHKVRHCRDGIIGALKELHPQHLRVRERRFRVYSEAAALQFLQGQGTPRLLGSNAETWDKGDGPLYLVTEWIEGHTLTNVVNGRPQPLNDAVTCISRLGATLERVHTAGILHRDLKPDNVICRDGRFEEPVLVDFGMAWHQPDEGAIPEFHTPPGQEIGNRFLRLPEHAAGVNSRDARSDVAALVGLLFYILTGKAPRILLDEQGRMPHERASFLPELTSDPRWSRLTSLFATGFQVRIEYRYSTIAHLREVLASLESPTLPADDDLDRALAELRALQQSDSAREADELRALLAPPIREMERMFTDFFINEGLAAVFHSYVDSPHNASAFFAIRLPEREVPSASGNLHWTTRNGEVIASYVVFQAGPALHEQQATDFYRGPVADVEALLRAQLQCFPGFASALLARFQEALRVVLGNAGNRG
jgi:serine/threonine protein kinase